MRFIHLPAENRASIILTLVAVATFALICVFISYDAAYQFVASTGLYTTRAAHLYPVLLDIGFLIAETTAINAVLTNRFARNTTIASRFWPHTLMLVGAASTVWINRLHAGQHPSSWLVAVLPPIAMMISFQALVGAVNATGALTGRDWGQTPTIQVTRDVQFGHSGSSELPTTSQTGHQLSGMDEPSKMEIARQLCRAKTDKELAAATDSSLVRDVKALGVDLSRRWAGQALTSERAARNSQISPRK